MSKSNEESLRENLLSETIVLDELPILGETHIEERWLKACLPVIIQPALDVKNGNELVKLMYEFIRDDRINRLNCRVIAIYAGESSYNRVYEKKKNNIATLFYRSYNRKNYERTADINYFEYRDVDLSLTKTVPWKSIYTLDHSGEQTWSQGTNGNILCWFSLMKHYVRNIPYQDWTRLQDGHRPMMHVNTCNHMWGEEDNNTELVKEYWVNYPVQMGDADTAMAFSKRHIPTKCNFYSCCCFCIARNGGGCCDRTTHAEKRHDAEDTYCVLDDDQAKDIRGTLDTKKSIQ